LGSGVVCVSRESVFRGSRVCAGVFGRNLASVVVKMFSHLNYLKKRVYTFCTFDAICKVDASIICICVRHKM
jgi:hypothetical protein